MRQLFAVLTVAVIVGCQGGSTTPSKPASVPLSTKAEAANKVNAEVKGIFMCCADCQKDAKDALAKVDGISDVTTDVKEKKVTYKARDGKTANAGGEALHAAGFGGELKHDGGDSFATVGKNLTGGKQDQVTIKGVHVCCDGCEKAIRGLFKDAGVTFDGKGSVKDVVIKGKDLNAGDAMNALAEAGFWGKISLK
ncbi:MAG: heavy-metal-associated domain-containing protein [Gemmataceae bacterium]|nr:heavy-metal-associated domain-containing protein [Gemmataceae bacterium]